jgi:hypothetical protein
MDNQKWQELYLLAAKEADGKKVPERATAVRRAIRERLEHLEGDGNHHDEKLRLKTALKTLNTLETEARRWLLTPDA